MFYLILGFGMLRQCAHARKVLRIFDEETMSASRRFARLQIYLSAGGYAVVRHAFGHHMKTTLACSHLTMEEFRRDFDAVHEMLASHGAHLFRPPSDFGTREQIAYTWSRSYRTMVGTVFPLDHWLENQCVICRLAAWPAIDGGIMILARRGGA